MDSRADFFAWNVSLTTTLKRGSDVNPGGSANVLWSFGQQIERCQRVYRHRDCRRDRVRRDLARIAYHTRILMTPGGWITPAAGRFRPKLAGPVCQSTTG